MRNQGGAYKTSANFSHLGMSDHAIAQMIAKEEHNPGLKDAPAAPPTSITSIYKTPTYKTNLFVPTYDLWSNKYKYGNEIYKRDSKHDRLLLWALDLISVQFPIKKHGEVKEMISSVIKREINAYATENAIKNEIRKVIKFEIDSNKESKKESDKDKKISELQQQLSDLNDKLNKLIELNFTKKSKKKKKSKR